MADIYKINSNAVIGGPGRLVYAPFGTQVPTKIGDIMDLNDYSLKAGWQDLGATQDGISLKRGFDTDNIEVDQALTPIGENITGWTHTIETKLAENTIENRQFAMIGSPITEVPPTLGDATTLSNDVTAGATILTVASTTGFVQNGYLKIGDEVKKIASVDSSSTKITLSEPLSAAHTSTDEVAPITELGYKKIGYGAVDERPMMMVALISQKKDGSLICTVVRKAQVAGDDKEQMYDKNTRVINLNLVAYPVDGVATNENVYFELEQVIG